MKFISKHKSSIVGLLIFIAVLAAFLVLKSTVMFDENQAIYGSRKNGQVKVTTEQINKIKDAVKDIAKSVKVEQRVNLINIIVYTNPDVNLETAKSIGDKALPALTDEQKKINDIQIIVENEENKAQFPIMGYKHPNSEVISWTKDRAQAEG